MKLKKITKKTLFKFKSATSVKGAETDPTLTSVTTIKTSGIIY